MPTPRAEMIRAKISLIPLRWAMACAMRLCASSSRSTQARPVTELVTLRKGSAMARK